MKSALKVFVASLAFAAASANAVAGPSEYYDFTSFSSATLGGAGGTEYVFDSLAPGGGNTQSFLGNPVIVAGSGVSFTANESLVADAGVLGNPTVIYSAKTGTGDPNSITATLTGATALGFYYGSYLVANSVLNTTVTAGGLDYTFGSLTPPSTLNLGLINTYNFVGFTSVATITKVVFTQAVNDNALDIQRFYVGTVAAIPEPSVALMFGAGLALLGAIGRRRRV